MAFNRINSSKRTNMNMDESENNAKISDSAYSNSCSNSLARSRSSHSTRSGSHSSRSSGYGGRLSTLGYSSGNNIFSQPPEIRCKIKKKKKQVEVKNVVIQEEKPTVLEPEPKVQPAEEQCLDDVGYQDVQQTESVQAEKIDLTTTDRSSVKDKDGFSCVISMQDGVVMYTTYSLTNTLGFPRNMWIGRSFIDFVHPRDRNTFASQITNGIAIPKTVNSALIEGSTLSTLVCRIRIYRGLKTGFGIKNRLVSFMPFLLKLCFRNICDEGGNVIYLLVQATPFFSAFKVPNEIVSKAAPFVIRHAANGDIKYIDPESVPYLGYSPQDIINKDAFKLYHPNDLVYLRQVYETIIKEGAVPRSKPYRMMAQNGDYVKLETEWSSFVNPWSRKLEFVIGKHLLIEGPKNPDVFQTAKKTPKVTEEETNKAHSLRESIIRIMNKILTKPAEAAKQRMTKRCQDLASFMDGLIEEAPKTDDDIWLDIKQADSVYYDFTVQERDSVLLGGISPHHDSSDSKSSTETQMSYNQLNYSETLQRYFDSHLIYSGRNKPTCNSKLNCTGRCMSPMDQYYGDSGDMTSSCDSSAAIFASCSPRNYSSVRLTESALNKHNTIMKKELMKMHREIKLIHKVDTKKSSKESRLNKIEHLQRCNASFLPTHTGHSTVESEPFALKRTMKQSKGTPDFKHRCSTAKLPRRNQINSEIAQHSNSHSNVIASAPLTPPAMFYLGIPQHMSLISPIPALPGVLPACYVPAQQTLAGTSIQNETQTNTNQAYPMPYVMYGQPLYGPPLMYSSVNTMQQIQQMQQMQHMQHLQQMQQMQQMQQTQQNFMAQNFGAAMHPVGLPSANYEESTKSTDESKGKMRLTTSEDAIDKTDEESSYSSFYSNFFKSESGSAEDSDVKKRSMDTNNSFNRKETAKVPRRKMEPPWMEHVSMTSELIYQYQVLPKNVEEVLSRDKDRLQDLQQPSLVNDQLGQLYLDLQLEGVATKLILEEGITSSSSSGEENFAQSTKVKVRRRKREYSKLVMIYEEDTPLPPPEEDTGSGKGPFSAFSSAS